MRAFICLFVFVACPVFASTGSTDGRLVDLSEVIEKALPSAVQLSSADSENSDSDAYGSGVIIDPSGAILTNYHVVSKMNRIRVRFYDGSTVETSTVTFDKATDLALVKLDAKDAVGLAIAPFGDSDTVHIGASVFAIGSPFGLPDSVTRGVISAKGRRLHINQYEDFLQTDAAINPGNSGGPLFDKNGKLVGIVTAIRTKTGTNSGIAFAVSSRLAEPVAQDLLRFNRVPHSYLGVKSAALTMSERGQLGLTSGVKVTQLLDGDSPAKRAGLRVGDVILSVAHKPASHPYELGLLIAHQLPFHSVPLTVRRGATTTVISVGLWEWQGSGLINGDSARLEDLGISLAPITEAAALRYGFARGSLPSEGLLITHVESGSMAETARLKEGMVLLEVERTKVLSVDDLKKSLTSERLHKGALILVESPNGQKSYAILEK